MYTLRIFLLLALFSFAIAAPSSNESDECAPPKDEKGLARCCKDDAIDAFDIESVFKQCIDLVKDKPEKPASGESKGPHRELKPEGFECLDDCLMTKMGLLTNNALDTKALESKVKAEFTNDWASVGTKINEKCIAAAKSATEKSCTSGSDVYVECMFRESYLNCPEKLWNNSDACKANKERLLKCPRALPFTGCSHEN